MDIEQFDDVNVDVVVNQAFALPDIYAGMNAILWLSFSKRKDIVQIIIRYNFNITI